METIKRSHASSPPFFSPRRCWPLGLSASAEVKVVASIKPVHSLVAAVMEGVGEPGLIMEGAGSPHNYALKPSQAQMLESGRCGVLDRSRTGSLP
jgi:ABC-type Zn uptake system ZnuABC Zn-binding protein ZnuA